MFFMPGGEEVAVSFRAVSKNFGNFQALKDISFSIKRGTIHAIVGENGAGKSTLVSILSGFHQATKGSIFLDGNEIVIEDPATASRLGIAMVYQHFMQINNYTNLENIMLGSEFVTKYRLINRIVAAEKIKLLQDKFNLHFDLNKLTRDEIIVNKQKVEILKMLFRDAETLIFDEPTAVLTDDEIKGFLKTLVSLREQGKTVIFITHKLQEVKKICDSITVLRLGEVVANLENKSTPLKKIAKIMLGSELSLPTNTHAKKIGDEAIRFNEVSYYGSHLKLHNLNFSIFEGEITAFAGVAGNGQEELEMLISGIFKPTAGNIFFYGKDVTKTSPKERKNAGLSYIPNDIHKYGMVKSFNLTKNLVLRQLDNKSYFTRFLGFFKKRFAREVVDKIVDTFDVRGVNLTSKIIDNLSGGNQQKFIFGREVTSDHKILLVANPTRGLDLNAMKNIHSFILGEKDRGKAVILISYALDEVLALADRIIVLNRGKITMNKPFKEITREKINIHLSGGVEADSL